MPGENSGILAGYCTAVTGTGADPYTASMKWTACASIAASLVMFRPMI